MKTKWHNNPEWEAFSNEHNLPTLCIDLRMALNGGADPWSDERMKSVVGYLKARLGDWYPSVDENRIFDEAVRTMCFEVLRLVEEDKKERLLREIETQRIQVERQRVAREIENERQRIERYHAAEKDRAIWEINNQKLELILLLGRSMERREGLPGLPEDLKRDIQQLFKKLVVKRCKRCSYVLGTLPHSKYCGPPDPTTGEAASHDWSGDAM